MSIQIRENPDLIVVKNPQIDTIIKVSQEPIVIQTPQGGDTISMAAIWGFITGNLLNQTDLITYLAATYEPLLGFTPENVANKSTNVNLGTSDTLYPTQKAVKTYVDSQVSGLTFSKSLVKTISDVTLVNDSLAPGNSKYYGTDGTGVKGFFTLPSTAVWGNITGTLSNQTDLQTALNAKQNLITTGTTAQYFRGDLSLATFPTLLSQFTNDVGFITDAPSNGITYGRNNAAWVAVSGGGGGTVTQINTSAPITGGPITATGTIGITQATTSTNGYLSSTDWNTFNSKESALTFSTGLTRTSNTITANLSTGIAGGQSVIGGTASAENLTLSSTSNATKGQIRMGTAYYDENLNRYILGGSTGVFLSASAGIITIQAQGNTINEGLTFDFQQVSDQVYVGSGTNVNTWIFTFPDISLSSNGGNLRVNSNNSQAANLGGTIALGGNRSGAANVTTFAVLAGRKENGTNNDTAGYLQLGTRASGGNVTEAIRINSSQNVGIGVFSSISARVHILSTTEQLRVAYDSSNYLSTTVNSTGLVTFNTNGSTPYFRFSDFVGINTDTPNVYLDIHGSLAAVVPGTQDVFQLTRDDNGSGSGSGGSYPQVVTFAIGTWFNNGVGNAYGPATRLDIKLKSSHSTTQVADVTVMCMGSNGDVAIGTTGIDSLDSRLYLRKTLNNGFTQGILTLDSVNSGVDAGSYIRWRNVDFQELGHISFASDLFMGSYCYISPNDGGGVVPSIKISSYDVEIYKQVSIFTLSAPTAMLEIAAGTATAGTASLKINPGVLLSTEENGAIESDGTHIYWTDSSLNRWQLDQQSGGGGGDTWKTIITELADETPIGDTLVASGNDTLIFRGADDSIYMQGILPNILYAYINTGHTNTWGAVQDFGNTFLKFGGFPINIAFLGDQDRLVFDSTSGAWINKAPIDTVNFSYQLIQAGETLTIPVRQQMVVQDLEVDGTLVLDGDVVLI